jgi:predicted GNAT family acetyltransferase
MEKTAVEWLVSQLNKQGFAQVVTDEEIKQAKEMEKKQSIEFACEVMFGYKDVGINLRNPITSKYNEIFKSE